MNAEPSPAPMRAALLSAVRDADDGAGLVAVLPVGGRTLIERQARLAVRAGATHLVLLVERVPAGLTAAVDRLRGEGVRVDVARSAGDAADRFHPDDRVLLFADGVLASDPLVARLADEAAPALLTIGEAMPDGGFERIDAATRWTGVALVSGDFLRRTVTMLGDWDLHSTLLRRAAAASARRIDVADGAGLGRAEPAFLVRSRAGARLATQAVLARVPTEGGWATRLVHGRIAAALTPHMLDRPVEAVWLRWAALALTALAAVGAWPWPAMAAAMLAVLGAATDALGRRLDAVRLGARGDARLETVRAVLLAATLLVWSARTGAAVPVLLAVATIAATAASLRERRALLALGPLDPGAAPRWTADADGVALLLVPFAIAGHMLEGVGLAAIYAAASFAAVQARVVRASEGLAPR